LRYVVAEDRIDREVYWRVSDSNLVPTPDTHIRERQIPPLLAIDEPENIPPSAFAAATSFKTILRSIVLRRSSWPPTQSKLGPGCGGGLIPF